jgi:oligopeptide/dipeptide ABC transporter ATP-binding protein
MTITDPILRVRHLTTRFAEQAPVVDDVSFDVPRHSTLAIVGENGSGKSVLGLSLMRLVPEPGHISGGEVLFEGRDLVTLSERQMQRVRGAGISMVSQEQTMALSPVHTVGWHVTAALRFRQRLSARVARERAIALLGDVELPAPEEHVDAYPHQLSRGMQKRVLIAMALAAKPRLLIADEPTSLLDPPIQAQILDLFRRLTQEGSTSVVFITNDLGVVLDIASEIVVMYKGRVVEIGSVASVFKEPQHPYTRLLLDSVPELDPEASPPVSSSPHPSAPTIDTSASTGCRFAGRCELRASDPARFPRCTSAEPGLEPEGAHHRSRCFYPSFTRLDDADGTTD